MLKLTLVLYPALPGGDRDLPDRPQWVEDLDILQRQVEREMERRAMYLNYLLARTRVSRYYDVSKVENLPPWYHLSAPVEHPLY